MKAPQYTNIQACYNATLTLILFLSPSGFDIWNRTPSKSEKNQRKRNISTFGIYNLSYLIRLCIFMYLVLFGSRRQLQQHSGLKTKVIWNTWHASYITLLKRSGNNNYTPVNITFNSKLTMLHTCTFMFHTTHFSRQDQVPRSEGQYQVKTDHKWSMAFNEQIDCL